MPGAPGLKSLFWTVTEVDVMLPSAAASGLLEPETLTPVRVKVAVLSAYSNASCRVDTLKFPLLCWALMLVSDGTVPVRAPSGSSWLMVMLMS